MEKTLYQRAKDGARGIALAGLAGLAVACGEPEVKSGVIEKESFYPDAGGWGGSPDRYTALIKTQDGETIAVTYTFDEAREMDLKYNVGDKVSVVKNSVSDKYRILQ